MCRRQTQIGGSGAILTGMSKFGISVEYAIRIESGIKMAGIDIDIASRVDVSVRANTVAVSMLMDLGFLKSVLWDDLEVVYPCDDCPCGHGRIFASTGLRKVLLAEYCSLYKGLLNTNKVDELHNLAWGGSNKVNLVCGPMIHNLQKLYFRSGHKHCLQRVVHVPPPCAQGDVEANDV